MLLYVVYIYIYIYIYICICICICIYICICKKKVIKSNVLTLLEFLCSGKYKQSPNRCLIKQEIPIGSVLAALGRNTMFNA